MSVSPKVLDLFERFSAPDCMPDQEMIGQAMKDAVALASPTGELMSETDLLEYMASKPCIVDGPSKHEPVVGYQEAVIAVVESRPEDFVMPPKQYIKKGQRFTLVFQGVCSHCAHCGQPLSDSVSIERGIGPICSKKGYMEDPSNPDEMQAMIDLAEFPELVQFLSDQYKPQGVRGLMNGLVRICSLNRRSPVHQACTDAIESLGYRKLASLLRESISVVEVSDCKDHPGNYVVWVKKSEWSWNWTNDIRREIPGSFPSRAHKGTIVPHTQKPKLWELMLKHYSGLCAKVPNKDGDGFRYVKLVSKK